MFQLRLCEKGRCLRVEPRRDSHSFAPAFHAPQLVASCEDFHLLRFLLLPSRMVVVENTQ